MKTQIIGRLKETKILRRLLNSNQPELLAIYGRRRVGKTYLIKNYCADHMKFICVGESGGNQLRQLSNFNNQINLWFPGNKQLQPPVSWQQAFILLRECLETLDGNDKKVIFFDELPWLETHKSGFLSAFGYFWNIYLSERTDILVVICGSAASWMIKKIVNNKGGLHNRITQRIRLEPFNLNETKQYLKYKKISFSDYQILQLYMVMGGIPHYLNTLQRGESLHQSIDNACFKETGVLFSEFRNLYEALFIHSERHLSIIYALAQKNVGMTRNELLGKTTELKTGGGLTNVLDELIESGFVEKIEPFNKKKKESLYRLMDEFSLFYLKFMQDIGAKTDWLSISKTPKYLSWCGYAYENICMKHIAEIKKALGIAGINVSYSSWYQPGNKNAAGAQIDLLLERSDATIQVCEIKFAAQPFTIDKKYSQDLQQKISVFRQDLPIGYAMILTFITTYGVASNDYKAQLVDSELTMEALFELA